MPDPYVFPSGKSAVFSDDCYQSGIPVRDSAGFSGRGGRSLCSIRKSADFPDGELSSAHLVRKNEGFPGQGHDDGNKSSKMELKSE